MRSLKVSAARTWTDRLTTVLTVHSAVVFAVLWLGFVVALAVDPGSLERLWL